MAAASTKPTSTKPTSTNPKAKDRIDLRLYNTIVIFDVYMISRSPEEARKALLESIANGDAKPTEIVAKEITAPNSIRSSWLDQTPYVAGDISDGEFEDLRGITTSDAFARFYCRR